METVALINCLTENGVQVIDYHVETQSISDGPIAVVENGALLTSVRETTASQPTSIPQLTRFEFGQV